MGEVREFRLVKWNEDKKSRNRVDKKSNSEQEFITLCEDVMEHSYQ